MLIDGCLSTGKEANVYYARSIFLFIVLPLNNKFHSKLIVLFYFFMNHIILIKNRGLDNQEYAVKIFKTSILVFKDRDKYVTGEVLTVEELTHEINQY